MKSLTLLKCRYKPLSPLGAFEFSSVSSVHLLARRSIVHSYTASDPDPFELSKNEIVVLDFSAQWCGPCKAVVPQYKILSEQYPMAKFLLCRRRLEFHYCKEILRASRSNVLSFFTKKRLWNVLKGPQLLL